MNDTRLLAENRSFALLAAITAIVGLTTVRDASAQQPPPAPASAVAELPPAPNPALAPPPSAPPPSAQPRRSAARPSALPPPSRPARPGYPANTRRPVPARPYDLRRVSPPRVGPYKLRYVEGAAVPEGYMKDTHIRKGLVIAGGITFGASWLFSAMAATVIIKEQQDRDELLCVGCTRASGNDGKDGAALFVPVVGPWIALGTLRTDSAGTAALFLDGVAQTGGLAMFIAGLVAEETVLVRTPSSMVAVAPTAPGVPSGLSLVGTFY